MADAHTNSRENNIGGTTGKVFNDEEVRMIEIYNIYNYAHDDGPTVWDNIFRSLRNGITKEGMLQLISLACHIQSREGEPLMKGRSSNHRTKTFANGAYLIQARTRLARQAHEPAVLNQDQEDAESKFKAICYFAACLMRLVTKTPDNFMRGLSKIKDQFQSFYPTTYSAYLASIKFDKSMAENIALAFHRFPVFKHTIVHHVAIADAEHHRNWDIMGLLHFACVLRLQFHGMTVYTQYAELINKMTSLSCGQYLTWLRCPQNNAALNLLRHITVNYACRKEEERRFPSMFWKYARIFDNGYFKEFELVSCKYLVATQAYLSIKRCLVKEAESALNIGIIKNDHELLMSTKLMADEFDKAYKMLLVHLGKVGPIVRIVDKITDEMASEYVRTYDLLSVHSKETAPLWRSIHGSNTEFMERRGTDEKERRGHSGTFQQFPPDIRVNKTRTE